MADPRASRHLVLRTSQSGEPRGALCGMGVCFECRGGDGVRTCRGRARTTEAPGGEFDVLVVGAGPGGLAAAVAASERGARVALVDDNGTPGGQLWRGRAPAAEPWLRRLGGVTWLLQTQVIAAPAPGELLAERGGASGSLRWGKLILATGARELSLPFPGWTLPGVVGAGGLQALAKQGLPVAGHRVVVAGSGPLLPAVAAWLAEHRARVVLLAEQAPAVRLAPFAAAVAAQPAKLRQALELWRALRGVPQRWGVWPRRAEGDGRLRAVVLTDGVRTWRESCDWLACGFGLVPNTELAQLLGCRLTAGHVLTDPACQTSVPGVYCVGEPVGIGGAEVALIEGEVAGRAATGDAQACRPPWVAAWRALLARSFALRPEVKALADDATLLCRCEDVAVGQARCHPSWRAAKLQTRLGMGACQGRICGAAARALWGWEPSNARPPLVPVPLGALLMGKDEGTCSGEV